MKYSITVTLWSALAVLIFTRIIRTVAFPLPDSTVLKSVPIEKTVWLFSTNTNKFVRVKGSNVDALGLKTDESAKLQLESTLKGFIVGVRIRSVTENSYLCVNSNGDLTVEVHGNTLDRCVFKEGSYLGHTIFQSMYNQSWHLGFKRNGKIKQPHNTTNLQKAARFMPYRS